jgi:hypothetical protein
VGGGQSCGLARNGIQDWVEASAAGWVGLMLCAGLRQMLDFGCVGYGERGKGDADNWVDPNVGMG